MSNFKESPLFEQFGSLEDPRIERTKLLRLQEILDESVCAIICGAGNRVEVAGFRHAKGEWWEQMLDLALGIPSHDTCGPVFALAFGTPSLDRQAIKSVL